MRVARLFVFVLLAVAACRAAGEDGAKPVSVGSQAGQTSGGGDGEAGGPDASSGRGGAPPATQCGNGEAPPEFDASGCVHPDVDSDCSEGFCRIPAGCFVMGSPENEPGRGLRNEQRTAVTLTRDFLIGQYEVTQEDFTVQGLANPSKVFETGPRVGKGNCLTPECPVGNVTWYEAVAFANLLSERSEPPLEACYVLESCTGELGKGLECQSVTLSRPTVYECEGYRLPTDAEWEYAARAGTRSAFYSGDIDSCAEIGTCTQDPALDGVAWYCSNSDYMSFPVGQLTPNGFGLYDMLGNLAEWINDPFDGRSSPSMVDPRGTLSSATLRYTRGGNAFVWPTACRASNQSMASLDLPTPLNGFRLARTLFESEAGGAGGVDNAGGVSGAGGTGN